MADGQVSDMATSGLQERVCRALDGNPYLSRHYRLDVTENNGHVTLVGQVGTFFQKQMAQELLRTVDGIQQIENRLEVAWN